MDCNFGIHVPRTCNIVDACSVLDQQLSSGDFPSIGSTTSRPIYKQLYKLFAFHGERSFQV